MSIKTISLEHPVSFKNKTYRTLRLDFAKNAPDEKITHSFVAVAAGISVSLAKKIGVEDMRKIGNAFVDYQQNELATAEMIAGYANQLLQPGAGQDFKALGDMIGNPDATAQQIANEANRILQGKRV